jgi:hypothetical protein
MAGPLAGAGGDQGVPTINVKKHRWWAPWEVLSENSGAPTINARNIDGEPPGPYGGSGPHPGYERCAVICIDMIDKK